MNELDRETRELLDRIKRAIGFCNIHRQASQNRYVRLRLRQQKEALKMAQVEILAAGREYQEALEDPEFGRDWLETGERQAAEGGVG